MTGIKRPVDIERSVVGKEMLAADKERLAIGKKVLADVEHLVIICYIHQY